VTCSMSSPGVGSGAEIALLEGLPRSVVSSASVADRGQTEPSASAATSDTREDMCDDVSDLSYRRDLLHPLRGPDWSQLEAFDADIVVANTIVTAPSCAAKRAIWCMRVLNALAHPLLDRLP